MYSISSLVWVQVLEVALAEAVHLDIAAELAARAPRSSCARNAASVIRPVSSSNSGLRAVALPDRAHRVAQRLQRDPRRVLERREGVSSGEVSTPPKSLMTASIRVIAALREQIHAGALAGPGCASGTAARAHRSRRTAELAPTPTASPAGAARDTGCPRPRRRATAQSRRAAAARSRRTSSTAAGPATGEVASGSSTATSAGRSPGRGTCGGGGRPRRARPRARTMPTRRGPSRTSSSLTPSPWPPRRPMQSISRSAPSTFARPCTRHSWSKPEPIPVARPPRSTGDGGQLNAVALEQPLGVVGAGPQRGAGSDRPLAVADRHEPVLVGTGRPRRAPRPKRRARRTRPYAAGWRRRRSMAEPRLLDVGGGRVDVVGTPRCARGRARPDGAPGPGAAASAAGGPGSGSEARAARRRAMSPMNPGRISSSPPISTSAPSSTSRPGGRPPETAVVRRRQAARPCERIAHTPSGQLMISSSTV